MIVIDGGGKDAEADRRFLQDVLSLQDVDAGDGWLIPALRFAPSGDNQLSAR